MRALTVIALLVVAIAFGLALAHALELPGKLRLAEPEYMVVQNIYYPGFTIGGIVSEPGGLAVLGLILALTKFGTSRFWWTAAAFMFLASMHATFWLVTHHVNSAWVSGVAMSGPAKSFFEIFGTDIGGDWRALRNTWEISHVARAILAAASLVSLAYAATLFERDARPPSAANS